MHFRFHRGTFADSMATRQSFHEFVEVFARIEDELRYPVTQITIAKYCNDPRIPAQTYLVTGAAGVIGMIDDAI